MERLMRAMGICGLFPKPNTSKSHPRNFKYPYLLTGLEICYPNQVWGTDITFVRIGQRWFYLVAVLDWFSRYVVAWKLSSTLAVDFCVVALKEALAVNLPDICNSDQGSQFTSEEYQEVFKAYPQIRISMDGRSRCFHNIFTERLWRTVKYEEVYLHDYQSFIEAEESLKHYFQVYNYERLHSALNYQTPAEVYFQNQTIKSNILKVEKLSKKLMIAV